MTKKADLASALADIGGSARKKAEASPPPEVAEEQTTTPEPFLYKQPSRVATKPITVHYPRVVRDRLKILAIEEGKTLQSLIGEAFNDLFAKYGKPEIAPKD